MNSPTDQISYLDALTTEALGEFVDLGGHSRNTVESEGVVGTDVPVSNYFLYTGCTIYIPTYINGEYFFLNTTEFSSDRGCTPMQ